MKTVKPASILLIGVLFYTSTYPCLESIFSAFCCCFKERQRHAAIQRDYDNRNFLYRAGEGLGMIEHDHSTGEWNTTQGFKDMIATSKRLREADYQKERLDQKPRWRQKFIDGKHQLVFE